MDESTDVGGDLGLYVTAAGGLLGAAHAAGSREIAGFGDAAPTVLAMMAGAFAGLLLGLLAGVAVVVIHTVAVAPAVGWWRRRLFGRAALVIVPWSLVITVLLRWWPDRFLPAFLIAGFGGWSVFLARRWFGESAHLGAQAVPHLGGVAVATLVGEQLVFGNLLSTTYIGPVLLLFMTWLSWCGWRAMRTARRVTVRAAADIVWSVQLGLLLSLALVWLAGVLSLTPTQVTATRAVLERAQSLTAVHWAYWLTAYTAIAVSSFLVLRWPQRFGEVRLPVFGVLNTGKRTLAGVNIGLMVALVFTITAVPVAEGAWKRQVEERYALETRHIQHAEGEEAAYEQIHQYVTTNRRVAAHLRPLVVAVHEAAPTEPGQPVADSTLAIARQLGRFQAATLHLGDPRQAPLTVLSGDPDVSEAFAALDEAQRARSQQETRSGRFADAAAAAVASTLDIPDPRTQRGRPHRQGLPRWAGRGRPGARPLPQLGARRVGSARDGPPGLHRRARPLRRRLRPGAQGGGAGGCGRVGVQRDVRPRSHDAGRVAAAVRGRDPRSSDPPPDRRQRSVSGVCASARRRGHPDR